jgi:hypothetical protein
VCNDQPPSYPRQRTGRRYCRASHLTEDSESRTPDHKRPLCPAGSLERLNLELCSFHRLGLNKHRNSLLCGHLRLDPATPFPKPHAQSV